jgi:hypothetical protein
VREWIFESCVCWWDDFTKLCVLVIRGTTSESSPLLSFGRQHTPHADLCVRYFAAILINRDCKNSVHSHKAHVMTQTTQKTIQMVVLENGTTVQALTPERLEAIVNGMIAKGKVLTMEDDKRYIKGIAIQGDGNAHEGNIGLRYIYNVDLVSMVATQGPKAIAAQAAINAALETGDLLAVHNACREYLNAVTVSFSVPSRTFNRGDLVRAQVRTVTTENGSLITLEKISAEPAEALKARPELKVTFTFGNKAAELKTAGAGDNAAGPVVNLGEVLTDANVIGG